MADSNDTNNETGVEQKGPSHSPDVIQDPQSSTNTNEAEKATAASTSGSNIPEENPESAKSAAPIKSKGTTTSNPFSDLLESKGTNNVNTSTNPNESQAETEVDAVSPQKQPASPVEPNPSVNLNTVEGNDGVSTTSSQKEHQKTKTSNTSSDDDEERRRKSKDPSSDQNNPKKVHSPNITSNVDQPHRPTVSDISYYSGEPDLLESVLTNATDQNLIDRLLGCVYGQALGDAYGLSTEFEDRERVAQNYPDKTKLIPFPGYILTGHNRRWKRGDWTDDTDQWILILDTLTDPNGNEKMFAKKLKDWILYGYPELGDHGGMGLGANVSQVVRSHNYLYDPLRASEIVWEHGNRQAAPNGAVMRCSASAFVHFNNPEQVITTAELMCKTTHFDPRCIASCLAVCLAITYLLQEKIADNGIEELITRVQEETIQIIGDRFSDEDRTLFKYYTDTRTLEELNLDEERCIGYTYKCLASGFYGLRSTRSFAETLNDLIRYGGDADTNGAVCGTMYGARHGYRALPYEWLRAMPNKKWLDQKIIKCFEKMKLIGAEDMETS